MISSSVTTIDSCAFYHCFMLNRILHENRNSAFVSIEDNIFSKDLWTLICYQSCHSNSIFHISPSVTSISNSVFTCTDDLTSITIPSSVISIGRKAFAQCRKWEQISVENGNSAFVLIEGILFSKDIQTLICHPSWYPNSFYTIPPCVASIDDYALTYVMVWHLLHFQ